MQALSPLKDHPCFSEKAHVQCGRIHLPVAPGCNIRCAYCDRKYDCPNESRPGVSSRILSPKEALSHLAQMLQRYPQTRVVGIAGPGEPLFNGETFDTLRLVGRDFPQLLRCVSTNGSLLAERMDEIISCRVNTISVTINTLRTQTAHIIYPSLLRHQKHLEAQQKGVALAVKQGITVKINTVLIPGVNEDEIGEIACFAAANGAVLMNLIPLIPIGGMAKYPAPSAAMLEEARRVAAGYLPQFAHCKRCRADAAGIPGSIL